MKRIEKTYTMAEGMKLGPAGMLEKMMGDGFRFDSMSCPVKLTQPSGWSSNDGEKTITYWQELPDDN